MKAVSSKALILLISLICSSLSMASADGLSQFQKAIAQGIPVHGEALAKGVIATVLVDKEFLKSKLPESLELVPLEGVPENLHPVGMFMGQHHGLTSVIEGGSHFVVAEQYAEVTYGISNVRLKGSKTGNLYTYLTDLRLNSWPAIFMGWLYGFPKKPGQFEVNGLNLSAVTSSGSALINLQTTEITNYDSTHFARNLEFLKANLKPLVSVQLGRLVCSDFNWNLESAKLAPVALRIELGEEFIGANQSFETRGLDTDIFGSIQVETQWTMSPPHKCE